MTWKGCARMRRWKPSFPDDLIRYLLQATRAASRALEVICCFSSDTRCATKGKLSTDAFLFPQSKMRIFGSGTPRQYLDLMKGLFFWNLLQGAGPAITQQRRSEARRVGQAWVRTCRSRWTP